MGTTVEKLRIYEAQALDAAYAGVPPTLATPPGSVSARANLHPTPVGISVQVGGSTELEIQAPTRPESGTGFEVSKSPAPFGEMTCSSCSRSCGCSCWVAAP